MDLKLGVIWRDEGFIVEEIITISFLEIEMEYLNKTQEPTFLIISDLYFVCHVCVIHPRPNANPLFICFREKFCFYIRDKGLIYKQKKHVFAEKAFLSFL